MYEQSVPKEVLEILAEIMAIAKSLELGAFNTSDNTNGQGVSRAMQMRITHCLPGCMMRIKSGIAARSSIRWKRPFTSRVSSYTPSKDLSLAHRFLPVF
jgi:hypothetical protein